MEVRFGNRSWSAIVNSPVSGGNSGFSLMESRIPRIGSYNGRVSFCYRSLYRYVILLRFLLPRAAQKVSDSLWIRTEALTGLQRGLNIVDPRRFWAIVNARSAGERSRSNMLDQVLMNLLGGWDILIRQRASPRDIILYLLRYGIVFKDVSTDELNNPNILLTRLKNQLMQSYTH